MRRAIALALVFASASRGWSLIVPAGPATVFGSGAEPQICADASGAQVVAWWAFGPERIMMQRFDPNGGSLGAPVEVGAGREPAVACGAAGDFVVAFTATGSDFDVFARRYDDTGSPLGAAFAVNDSAVGDQLRPDVAIAPSGNFLVVWDSDQVVGHDRDVFAKRYDAAGVPFGSEFQVNTSVGDSRWLPRVSATPAGGFVVTWAVSFNPPNVQRYDALGNADGGELVVDPFGTGHAPAVGVGPSGDAMVVWESPGTRRLFDSAGSPLTSASLLSIGTFVNHTRVAAASSGDFAVAWGSGTMRNLFVRTYDSSGAASDAPQRIHVESHGGGYDPELAFVAADEFDVAWHHALELKRRRYRILPSLCTPAPSPGCITAERSRLTLSDNDADERRRKLRWTWVRNQTQDPAEFGDPTTTTRTALCIYDALGQLLSAEAPAGDVCRGAACWTAGPTGFTYFFPEKEHDGIRRVILSGTPTRGRLRLSAKGAGVHDFNLAGLTAPVTAQLVREGSATCWEAVYDADEVVLSTSAKFRAINSH